MYFKRAECEKQNFIKGIKLSYEFVLHHLIRQHFLHLKLMLHV